jgi:hypothetical protein
MKHDRHRLPRLNIGLGYRARGAYCRTILNDLCIRSEKGRTSNNMSICRFDSLVISFAASKMVSLWWASLLSIQPQALLARCLGWVLHKPLGLFSSNTAGAEIPVPCYTSSRNTCAWQFASCKATTRLHAMPFSVRPSEVLRTTWSSSKLNCRYIILGLTHFQLCSFYKITKIQTGTGG